MASARGTKLGLVGAFASADELVAATRSVRAAGFRRFDAFSPYPVHGIDEAMGTRPTVLPWLVLGAGVAGLAGALALQLWTNGVDYPFVTSGKPAWGLPAYVPVAFEVVILAGAVTAFVGMLALNGLPRWANPVLGAKAVQAASSTGFAVAIEAADPAFDEARARAVLAGAGASGVEAFHAPPRAPFPRPLVYGAWIALALALVPPALIVAKRAGVSRLPRVHLVRDMDRQPKRGAQAESPFFDDGRAARLPVAGTVAVGELRADAGFETGRADGDWLSRPPLEIDRALLDRGRERYAIHCAVCHGADGRGRGPVAIRAEALREPAWVPPSDLQSEHARGLADGELYDVVRNGVRNMAGYGDQLAARDRWAVVAYLRALQRSQNATSEDLPPGVTPFSR
ncbi:MAG: quinol:electron acceptor oxidoreductase subunit ActD [Planctomycetota bacterium]